ncbi:MULTISPECIES: hypothetical protein [unclassified Brevundimonas]|uniref:hypothetical protein n=1 Tax=unclassified Brevundimonas TaxID=2622653 RepID=UPI0025B9E46B|nr:MULTISPECIES: hypothetical protein [unclassified Brevundimonas]
MKWWAIAAGCAVLAIGAAFIVLGIIPQRELSVTAVAKITIELGPDNYAIGVDDYANFDLGSFAGLSEAQCIAREHCSVRIWRERDMPDASSLNREQIKSQLFAFKTDQNKARIGFNCRLYREVPSNMCLGVLKME